MILNTLIDYIGGKPAVSLKHIWLKIFLLTTLISISVWPVATSVSRTDCGESWGISEQIISSIITPAVFEKNLPQKIKIPDFQIAGPLTVNYSLDYELEQEAKRLFEKYNPDYGVFVALNPDNGRVLAMVDSTRDGLNHGNLSLVNTFPAASISKIITAVAAVEEGHANENTVIPFNGKSTSLYKKNVFKHKNNRWTRKLTLRESFAKSINTIFGRLGAVNLGGEKMFDYARKLGFNASFASDFSFNNGYIELNVGDPWEVAEMASGYTRRNTLSPIHAATIAATAVNGGKLVAPVLISSLVGPYGIPVYRHEQSASTQVMSENTAHQLSRMMQETVKKGSARKSFKWFHRGELTDVKVGGKTGSLTGFKPKGKYDWFVGFATHKGEKIAYAVLCINKEKWYVKSSQFARQMLEFYFTRSL